MPHRPSFSAPDDGFGGKLPILEACFFGTLKFNGGILFGLTPAVPRQTLRWQLEYEVHF
jgi:hypothetical protein